MNKIIEIFNLQYLIEYGGKGWIWLLLLISLLYLYFAEKEKHLRLIVIWGSIFSILVFMFPLTNMVFRRFLDGATYYRLIWSIPVGVIISYAFAKAISKHRIVGLLICAILIVLTGNKVYRNQYMSIAENEYHLPEQMIEICDVIHPDYYYVTACFPEEFIHQVPQYDSDIKLAFGREVLVAGWSNTNKFYELEKQTVIDVEKLTNLCIEEQVEYYIARKIQNSSASFSDYGWEKVFETNDYIVYRQQDVLSVWDKVKEWLSTLSEEERNAWLDAEGIPKDYMEN